VVFRREMGPAMTASVDDVAAAILARTGRVTTWKLQKLAYYAQSWHLARRGRRLFDDSFEAWANGPVVRSLYRQHQGMNRIAEWPAGNRNNLSADERQFVDWIVETYGHFTAEALSRMSHSETPWLVTRAGLPEGAPSSEVIGDELMRNFYSRQVASPADSVATAVANSYLEGVDLDEAWQERLLQAASGDVSADELIEQEIRRARAE
jgi:uncharacterized phage-associated protein